MSTVIDVVEYAECKPKGPQTFQRLTFSRAEFIARLMRHTTASDKFSGRLFAPNTFAPTAKARSKHGVTGVTALVFDVERKPSELTEPEVEALADRLIASGLEFVLTSSYSNVLPDKCRFRLVLFVNRPVLPTEFSEVRRRIKAQLQLEGIVDPAAEDVSRIFFWPSHPPGVEPSAFHRSGKDIAVDELLQGYVPAQFEPGRHIPPPGWEYQRPVDPPHPLDLSVLHGIMDKYRAAGEKDPQEKQAKVNLMRMIRKGQSLTKVNYDNCLWRAVNLLVWNLPAGTSFAEIKALMHPSMSAMYGAGQGPIPIEEAQEILARKIDRAMEARAAEEAGLQAVQKAFFEKPEALVAKLADVERNPPATAEDLKRIEEDLSETEFVFNITDDRFYCRAPYGFNTSRPLSRDGLIGYLREHDWEEEEIAFVLKSGAYTNAMGIDFAPRQPSLFLGHDGPYINAWRPPSIVPAPGEFPSIHRVLDSLTTNPIERDDDEIVSEPDPIAKEYLINWLAWAVQNPGATPGTAVLLNGAPQGSGKNILAHIMFEILGPDNCAKITTKSLEGRFTSRWIGKCFVFGDEIFARGQRPGQVGDITDTLKDLITGQQVISEGKGINEQAVRNRAKFLFASNAGIPIRLEEADRRFHVFTRHAPVTEEYRTFTAGLFTLDNASTPAFAKEIAAFAHYLERYQVDYQKVRRPYENVSRRDLIAASAPSHQTFCEHVDEHGIDELLAEVVKEKNNGYLVPEMRRELNSLFGDGWDYGEKGISMTAIYRCYLVYCKRTGIDRALAKNKLGGLIKQHQPPWPHLRLGTTGSRVRGYHVKRRPEDLEFRPSSAHTKPLTVVKT